MNDCLNNIVGLGFSCDDITPPLSGYWLRDAPELSTLNVSDIANEDYISGSAMAAAKLNLAKLEVYNDVMAVLTSNNIIAHIDATITPAGVFDSTTSHAPAPLERGIILYKNKARVNGIKQMRIKSISVYSLTNQIGAQVKVYDSGLLATYTMDLVANSSVKIPTNYTVIGDYAKIVIDNTAITMGGTKLTCFVGCNGTIPNDCGYVKGWNGTTAIAAKEGYGINLEFQCECDYAQLLCNLSSPYIGKILWLKTRVLLAEEWLLSNRNNSWTSYNREQTEALLTDIKQQYIETWNTFVGGLPNVVNGLRDSCLTCRQGRWLQNI